MIRGNIDMAVGTMTAAAATTPAVPAQGIGGQNLIAGNRVNVRITALLTGSSMQVFKIGHATMYTSLSHLTNLLPSSHIFIGIESEN